MVKSGNKTRRGGLAASPSHLMHRALQLALDIYAEEAGPDGLTQRQFAVLEAVSHRSGLTQTDLVRATGIEAADKRILALLPKAKRDGFLARLAELAGAADAAPDKAKAELKAAKKAAKLAKKADKPKLKLVEPA